MRFADRRRRATFKSIANEIHCDWHTIVIDRKTRTSTPARMAAFHLDRRRRHMDESQRLSHDHATIPASGSIPRDRRHRGSQDNGTHISGSPYWDGLGGDGGYTASIIATPRSRTLRRSGGITGGTISRRQGNISRTRTTGITIGDRVQFIPPLIMDPVTPTKLYFGTFRLYRTVDEANLWTSISNDLTRGTGTITTIAVAPSDAHDLREQMTGTSGHARRRRHLHKRQPVCPREQLRARRRSGERVTYPRHCLRLWHRSHLHVEAAGANWMARRKRQPSSTRRRIPRVRRRPIEHSSAPTSASSKRPTTARRGRLVQPER